MRAWGRALAVLVTAVTVTAGPAGANAEETDRLTGADAAHAEAGEVAADAVVALPDLGITHRLPSGGMNLWRMPLSELEPGHWQPELVKNLDHGGFSYDNSRTLPGDFADVTASDDGTADHVIWHAQPNGGVLLWAVGGGGDTTPRVWQDLRSGGWSWANSRPMVGDVTGDGWDDLVVRHWSGCVSGYCTVNVWVFPSDGARLGAPQLWSQDTVNGAQGLDWGRYLLADFDGDGLEDWISVTSTHPNGAGVQIASRRNTGSSFSAQNFQVWSASSGGWAYSSSRQMTGDVTGDGLVDLVTVHAQPNGGILVWTHSGAGCPTHFCVDQPELWQDLRTGGWSYAGSRQHLADTDGDWLYDLVSVHRQSGNPGMLIWRHGSTGTGLSTPQVIADLRTGGWTYSASREGVADTYGVY